MDFIKDLAGGKKDSHQQQQHQQQHGGQTSGGGGFMDKLNNMAGGGAKGEQKEDALDKGKIVYELYLPTLSWALVLT